MFAQVATKFEAVLSDDLAIAVRNLESVAPLRQFAFEIVSNGKSARNVDVRHTFPVRSKFRMDSQVGIIRIRETIRGCNSFAGILNQCRMLRVKESSLAFTEERESNFVHCRASDCPRVADVQLLGSFVRKIPKIRQGRPSSLEPCEWLRQIVLRKIVITGKAMVF